MPKRDRSGRLDRTKVVCKTTITITWDVRLVAHADKNRMGGEPAYPTEEHYSHTALTLSS